MKTPQIARHFIIASRRRHYQEHRRRHAPVVARFYVETEACSPYQLRPPPVPATRGVKKLSTACAKAWAVLPRQVAEVSCLRSSLVDMYPSSTRTDGTSGANNTLKPADLSGCLCSRAAVLSSSTTIRANCIENVLVSRCARSTRILATSSGSAVRSTPAMTSALFSVSANRAASASEAFSERV